MYPTMDELAEVVDNLADLGDIFDPLAAIHFAHLTYNRHILLGESLVKASLSVMHMSFKINAEGTLLTTDEFLRLRLLLVRIITGLFLGIEDNWVQGKTKVVPLDSFELENVAVVVHNDMVFI